MDPSTHQHQLTTPAPSPSLSLQNLPDIWDPALDLDFDTMFNMNLVPVPEDLDIIHRDKLPTTSIPTPQFDFNLQSPDFERMTGTSASATATNTTMPMPTMEMAIPEPQLLNEQESIPVQVLGPGPAPGPAPNQLDALLARYSNAEGSQIQVCAEPDASFLNGTANSTTTTTTSSATPHVNGSSELMDLDSETCLALDSVLNMDMVDVAGAQVQMQQQVQAQVPELDAPVLALAPESTQEESREWNQVTGKVSTDNVSKARKKGLQKSGASNKPKSRTNGSKRGQNKKGRGRQATATATATAPKTTALAATIAGSGSGSGSSPGYNSTVHPLPTPGSDIASMPPTENQARANLEQELNHTGRLLAAERDSLHMRFEKLHFFSQCVAGLREVLFHERTRNLELEEWVHSMVDLVHDLRVGIDGGEAIVQQLEIRFRGVFEQLSRIGVGD